MGFRTIDGKQAGNNGEKAGRNTKAGVEAGLTGILVDGTGIEPVTPAV
ncbi:hypothetical protein [Noviherbaspirillum galbum]|uniref:Uncharacterized protein n=1 Tax=Noviherbaspirillum galbum TaxID=2709383 RepID=A0A6B3SLL8_9BURK|nr:hypothetical protein [Noviherbaspirillum galbum]NEX61734.1 hypothetical protein [Noviherbaspirillum galbum]